MTYFVYNKRKNQYTDTYETVSTTFDLICDRSFLIGLAISICCFGAASAKPIVAWFSKHFGLRNFSVSVCCFTGLCYMIAKFDDFHVFSTCPGNELGFA